MTRPIKRNKTKLENLIMETWYDTSRGTIIKEERQGSIVVAIQNTLRHFEMEDYLYGSNHAGMFERVYLTERMTRFRLANELFVGENTLGRYTNIYIKCFEKFLIDFSKK